MNNKTLSLTVAASSLIAASAIADYTGLTCASVDNGDGTWTARIYVNFDAATDRVVAVFGDSQDHLLITSTNGFYQNSFGGPTSMSINPAFYDMFPSLLLDSWVTICNDPTNGIFDMGILDIGIDWTDFENGGDIYTENGSWFATPQDPLLPILYPCTYQFLVGQFTMYGLESHVSGVLNLQGKVGDFETFQARGQTFDFFLSCNDDGSDCNQNGIPDSIDVNDGASDDCNDNCVPDECDVVNGNSLDCDQNGVPDECQPDCDGDGWIDPCDPDADTDQDGIPDNCEEDCNGNTIPDHFEIKQGWAPDCNGNGIPDECEADCDADGIPDECEITDGAADCNGDGVPDFCQLTDNDCNGNAVPDECDLTDNDCNDNGIPDECDIDDGFSTDLNGNAMPDECEPDCNENGYPDEYDISIGESDDVNGDGIPDECQCIADTNNDGFVDITDIIVVIGYWGLAIDSGDINNDGIIDITDLILLIANWGPCE